MRPCAYGTAALLIVGLAGCGGAVAPEAAASPVATSVAPSPSASPPAALREPHSLVFSATGTAAVTSLTYELDGRKTTVKSVSLPWREVQEVPADGKRHKWSLTLKHGSGRVELVAIFDGAVVGQTRGQVSGSGGSGTAQVGGSLRG